MVGALNFESKALGFLSIIPLIASLLKSMWMAVFAHASQLQLAVHNILAAKHWQYLRGKKQAC